MNHLAHFQVAHPDAALMVGGFLGDFVKGRLTGDRAAELERGIRLHRAVDAYCDSHPVVKRSVARFEPPFRRYAPIMVDIIYDHFLAQQWHDFNQQDIASFCDDVFDALRSHEAALPVQARKVAQRMTASRSMEYYHRDSFVAGSLESIARRLSRDNPLARAFGEFDRRRDELNDDFLDFFPALASFCERWQLEN